MKNPNVMKKKKNTRENKRLESSVSYKMQVTFYYLSQHLFYIRNFTGTIAQKLLF